MVDYLVDLLTYCADFVDSMDVNFFKQSVNLGMIFDHSVYDFTKVLEDIMVLVEDAEKKGVIEDHGIMLNKVSVLLDTLYNLHVE